MRTYWFALFIAALGASTIGAQHPPAASRPHRGWPWFEPERWLTASAQSRKRTSCCLPTAIVCRR